MPLSLKSKRKLSRRGFFTLIILLILCTAGIFYFFYAAPYPSVSEAEESVELESSVQSPLEESDESSDAAPDLDAEEIPEPPLVIERVIESGDTAGKILNEWLGASEIQMLADACEDTFSLRRLRPGKPYIITINKGELASFVYEIDNTDRLIINREGPGAYTVYTEPIEYTTTMVKIKGEINSSLFQAVADVGERAGLAVSLADIFAWEINFIRDIQPGDSFRIIVEKRYRDGEFKGYGNIHAALFVNKGQEYEGFLFHDPEGRKEYFTSSGDSVKRAFLKAPLSFTRISSTFTNSRFHPIHKVWRAHPGIDYAAPTGTPVKAVGNGTVTFSGWGNGAGNYIALRHNNGYETMYLHLSRFDAKTKKGARVNQGDTIGYVGSTGDSTGPHLDFRMKKNGVYVNPLTELTPRSDPVSAEDMPEFLQLVASWREYLDGKKELPSVSPNAEPPKEAGAESAEAANRAE